MHDPVNDAELHFFLQELRLKLFAESAAQQKRPQPAFSGSCWKVSLSVWTKRFVLRNSALAWPEQGDSDVHTNRSGRPSRAYS